ncbi:MAG: hypothetical protein HQL63_15050 [Magnetococcales bacterium]|nr:hypothetical protein [Magnetococcales bacterium]
MPTHPKEQTPSERLRGIAAFRAAANELAELSRQRRELFQPGGSDAPATAAAAPTSTSAVTMPAHAVPSAQESPMPVTAPSPETHAQPNEEHSPPPGYSAVFEASAAAVEDPVAPSHLAPASASAEISGAVENPVAPFHLAPASAPAEVFESALPATMPEMPSPLSIDATATDTPGGADAALSMEESPTPLLPEVTNPVLLALMGKKPGRGRSTRGGARTAPAVAPEVATPEISPPRARRLAPDEKGRTLPDPARLRPHLEEKPHPLNGSTASWSRPESVAVPVRKGHRRTSPSAQVVPWSMPDMAGEVRQELQLLSLVETREREPVFHPTPMASSVELRRTGVLAPGGALTGNMWQNPPLPMPPEMPRQKTVGREGFSRRPLLRVVRQEVWKEKEDSPLPVTEPSPKPRGETKPLETFPVAGPPDLAAPVTGGGKPDFAGLIQHLQTRTCDPAAAMESPPVADASPAATVQWVTHLPVVTPLPTPMPLPLAIPQPTAITAGELRIVTSVVNLPGRAMPWMAAEVEPVGLTPGVANVGSPDVASGKTAWKDQTAPFPAPTAAQQPDGSTPSPAPAELLQPDRVLENLPEPQAMEDLSDPLPSDQVHTKQEAGAHSKTNRAPSATSRLAYRKRSLSQIPESIHKLGGFIGGYAPSQTVWGLALEETFWKGHFATPASVEIKRRENLFKGPGVPFLTHGWPTLYAETFLTGPFGALWAHEAAPGAPRSQVPSSALRAGPAASERKDPPSASPSSTRGCETAFMPRFHVEGILDNSGQPLFLTPTWAGGRPPRPGLSVTRPAPLLKKRGRWSDVVRQRMFGQNVSHQNLFRNIDPVPTWHAAPPPASVPAAGDPASFSTAAPETPDTTLAALLHATIPATTPHWRDLENLSEPQKIEDIQNILRHATPIGQAFTIPAAPSVSVLDLQMKSTHSAYPSGEEGMVKVKTGQERTLTQGGSVKTNGDAGDATREVVSALPAEPGKIVDKDKDKDMADSQARESVVETSVNDMAEVTRAVPVDSSDVAPSEQNFSRVQSVVDRPVETAPRRAESRAIPPAASAAVEEEVASAPAPAVEEVVAPAASAAVEEVVVLAAPPAVEEVVAPAPPPMAAVAAREESEWEGPETERVAPPKTATKPVEAVLVEDLGTGFANLMGDGVESVVKGAGWLFGKVREFKSGSHQSH